MFKIFKLKSLIAVAAVLVIAVGLGVGVVSVASVKNSPQKEYTIVIDAGHGGRDGGSVGEISVEKDLNLKYANELKRLLQGKVNVVMTRTGDDGLYDENENNKKLSDMRARRDIINSAKPDLVISIHMNSYPTSQCAGSKTFYKIDSEASKQASQCIQNSLHYYIPNASKTVAKGDYYILNCTNYNSVLIECGFISNPAEEKLLNSDQYMQQFIYSVYCGIVMFLGI